MSFRFDFALSFAGPSRQEARKLRDALRAEGFEVFMDEDYEDELIGVDASRYLRDVYTRQSRYCVVLISREYDVRTWTQLERESIQARELTGERDILIPVRLQDYAPDWLPASRIYFDLSRRPLAELIQILTKKARLAPIEVSRKLSFVQAVCRIVEIGSAADVHWAGLIFPDQVSETWTEGTSLSTLVERANCLGLIDSSFDKTLARLKESWDRFNAPFKRNLIDVIRTHGLAHEFGDRLFLSAEEERYLRIPWELADHKIAQERTKAYDKCRDVGVDLTAHTMELTRNFKPAMEMVKDILTGFLRSRVRIDLETIGNSVGTFDRIPVQDVGGRAQSEYFDLLEDFRKCLGHFGFSGQGTEQFLDDFKRHCNAICLSPVVPSLVCERGKDGSLF